jgi:DNA-3-methyladenine glycosylase I
MNDELVHDNDGAPRCGWACSSDSYLAYHDDEWGRPTADDRWIFEKLCLEAFQSGLSWLTILDKRDNFRRAFADFDAEQVARFGEADVERLMRDESIVRNRRKIEATIHNARRALDLRQEFGSLAAFAWQFEPETSALGKPLAMTDESTRLSKELKRRGWTFVGPTTMYAFMQAAGIVNDHIEGCCMRQACLDARARFPRPRAKHGVHA